MLSSKRGKEAKGTRERGSEWDSALVRSPSLFFQVNNPHYSGHASMLASLPRVLRVGGGRVGACLAGGVDTPAERRSNCGRSRMYDTVCYRKTQSMWLAYTVIQSLNAS